MAAAVFFLALLCEFKACFQVTHDSWLVLLALFLLGTAADMQAEFDPVYGLSKRAVEEWLARNPRLWPQYATALWLVRNPPLRTEYEAARRRGLAP